MTRREEVLFVAAGFSLLAVATTYPIVRRLATDLPGDLGDPLLTAWTLGWDADRLRHGLTGLWDAPNFFPYRHTLLYSDHLLGVALFTAPLYWLTGNAVVVYNFAYLASFVLAGCGMYLLTREVTLRRDAALIAGLVYACQPFRVSHLAHLQWLMTGWLPLSLWALHRYFATRAFKHLLAAGAFFLLQSLTAAYFTYFAQLPLVLVGVFEMWRTRPPLRRVALHVAGVGLLTAAVTAPIARAYFEVRERYGMHRTTEEIAEQSADVGDYFSAPPRTRLWRGLGTGRGEHELFPGALALVLAAVGIASAGGRRRSDGDGTRGPARDTARSQSPDRSLHLALYGGIAALAFVLSLGVHPTAWGHGLGVPGPYGLLLRVIPGLDGLRAVARLAVVVQIGLAVLAGFGASWLIDRLAPRGRLVALVLAGLAIVAEGWAAPIPTAPFDPRRPSDDRNAYAHLRTLSGGAVMELPTSVTALEREFVYQYMTLVHHHAVVNGHSGYISPLVSFLGGGHSPLSEDNHIDAALAMLRGIGVRYLIVHGAAFDEGALADAWTAALNRETRQVQETRRFGTTTLAVLTPADPPPGAPEVTRKVPPAVIRPRASHSADRLGLLFDGDPDSRWLSGGPQSGDEWIELALDRPRDIRVVRLELASRSFGDYPRDLAVEAVEDAGTRTLYRGPVLAQFVRGLIADPTYPNIEIVLPGNRTKVLRLRQLGATHRFFWSIHELTLMETPPADIIRP